MRKITVFFGLAIALISTVAAAAELPLEQIKRVELQRDVEQQLNVVHQQQIALGMLISQFT